MKIQVRTKTPLRTLARIRTLLYGRFVELLLTDGFTAHYKIDTSGGISLEMLNTISEELGNCNMIIY